MTHCQASTGGRCSLLPITPFQNNVPRHNFIGCSNCWTVGFTYQQQHTRGVLCLDLNLLLGINVRRLLPRLACLLLDPEQGTKLLILFTAFNTMTVFFSFFHTMSIPDGSKRSACDWSLSWSSPGAVGTDSCGMNNGCTNCDNDGERTVVRRLCPKKKRD